MEPSALIMDNPASTQPPAGLELTRHDNDVHLASRLLSYRFLLTLDLMQGHHTTTDIDWEYRNPRHGLLMV